MTTAGDGITTLCHCWRVRRRDGVVLGFTDHDRSLTVDATVFEPASGLTATEARRTLGLAADATDVAGALTSDRIAEADIVSGAYDGAQVETLLVDWRRPEAFRRVASAEIARIVRADGAFTAELQGKLADFDRPRGRYYRRGCDAELGDRRCRIDLALPGLTASGIVEAVTAQNLVRVGGLEGYAPDWFACGRLTLHLMPHAPVRVLSHRLESGLCLLELETDGAFAGREGDSFTVVAGCDKRFETCRKKFANSLNFQGFPHLPGNDAAYAYASEDQIFDGGPLVP